VKKIFATLAAVLFVLSFAASAFAIHAEIPAETQAVVAKGATQITLGGEIRFRGWYYNNLNPQSAAAVPGVPMESNSKAHYDTRVRLSIDAKVSDNVQGFIQLETGAGNADTYTWGNAGTIPILGNQAGGRKQDALGSLLQAWVLYKGTGLFGFPAGLKIGHMPLMLGEGQFFNHTQFGDDAIVFYMDPNKQVHIGLLTVKFGEGATTGDNTDDTDAYVGLITYKINDKNTIGLNYTYVNNSDGLDPADSRGTHLHNLGLHGNGSTGNFGYKGEVDFQFGSIDLNAGTHDSMRFRGVGLMLAGNYKMDSLNFRGSLAYGSGDNDAANGRFSEFVTAVGTQQHYTFVYDYRAVTTSILGFLNGGKTGTGIANTTYYNLGLDYQATKDIKTAFDLYILRATRVGAFEDILGKDVSKNAGWELDASVTYQVAKNLTYAINAGYFKAGHFYQDVYGPNNKAATVVNNVLTLQF